jgi:large subunit ribosomal protein L18
MNIKTQARLRRGARTRKKIGQLGEHRLQVHKTPNHIYAQVISPNGNTIACASTLDKELRKTIAQTGNVQAATLVGQLIASRIKSTGITKVAFDRSGYKYHGRVKALAEAAREAGINF